MSLFKTSIKNQFEENLADFQRSNLYQKPTPLSSQSNTTTVILYSNTQFPSNGKGVLLNVESSAISFDVIATYSNCSLVKQFSLITFAVKIPASPSLMANAGCGYCKVIQGGVAHLCFVNGYEHINENNCVVNMTIDVWHTANDWYHITSMYVDRITVSDHTDHLNPIITGDTDGSVTKFNLRRLDIPVMLGHEHLRDLYRTWDTTNTFTTVHGTTVLGTVDITPTQYHDVLDLIRGWGDSDSYRWTGVDIAETVCVPSEMAYDLSETIYHKRVPVAFPDYYEGIARFQQSPYIFYVLEWFGQRIVIDANNLSERSTGTGTVNASPITAIDIFGTSFPPVVGAFPASPGTTYFDQGLVYSDFPRNAFKTKPSLTAQYYNSNPAGDAAGALSSSVSDAQNIAKPSKGQAALIGAGELGAAGALASGGAIVAGALVLDFADKYFNRKSSHREGVGSGLLSNVAGNQFYAIGMSDVDFATAKRALYSHGYSVGRVIDNFNFGDYMFQNYMYVKGSPLTTRRGSMFFDVFQNQLSSGVYCWSDIGTFGTFPS